MVGNFMIRKVSPLNAAFLGIRKPATKVSNNMNKMFANASGLRKRKVWNLKQKLSSNFSQSFLCDVAEFAKKKRKTKKQTLVEKKPRGFNNWEKAREVRSQLSTAQRLSQDVRGWLNYAKQAGLM